MNENWTAWKEQFQNPDSRVRSFPFWAWNGRLDEEELIRQVKELKKAGVGGFFIHSRDGLETKYMGGEWMAAVKAVVEEAKAQGLYVWLYDEDRWPSGTAGGRVTRQGDAYRCKGLTLEVLPAADYPKLYAEEIRTASGFQDDHVGILAAYRADADGDRLMSFQRLSMTEGESFAENEVLLAVRLEVSAPSAWFNHEAPPDNLNPDCVRLFIKETHERYKEAVGEEFGKTILGIFTDEPSLHDRHACFGERKGWIPWTFGYGAYFTELNGYDFLDVLPWMYFDGELSGETRHDYWHSIARRYGESYFKTIGDWCSENHLLFTGHFLQEDKLGLSVRVNGAVMSNYQYQHVPGIDMLCEQTDEYLTVKQCTSVAHQLGKKEVLTETYGCTGWEFTFEGQKWVGDWQYVLGVNRRCQHLALYSLRGCRKRDYPPSFHYNNNWWGDNRCVEDYFARAGVFTGQGEPVRRILLLHPVSTAWSQLGVSPYGNPVRRKERDVPKLNEYGNQVNELIACLMRNHLDCDLGDEILIHQYGEAKDGTFRIGQASYDAVVVPFGMRTMLPDTWRILKEFRNQGGRIYSIGTPPSQCCGREPEGDAGGIAEKEWTVVKTREELVEVLEPYRTIRITDSFGQENPDILYQLRKSEEGYSLFLVNHSRDKDGNAEVSLPFQAEVQRCNLENGEIAEETDAVNDAEGVHLQLRLGKTGSAAYVLKPVPARTEWVAGPCAYRLSHPNVLTLDRCRYRMGQGKWSDMMEVWQAQKQVRECLGMETIHLNGMEQRYKWIFLPHPGDNCPLEQEFVFWSEVEQEDISLALECPERFEALLNGVLVDSAVQGYFLDREFQVLKLGTIRKGENRLKLSCQYRNDMELENLYLIGAFGVTPERKLDRLPAELELKDWTEQGLKHYCGSVTYQMEYEYHGLKEVWLSLPDTAAVCVKIRINDHEIQLPWDFSRNLSVAPWLNPGRNRLEIEVVGSPRNMMGPFHLAEKPVNTHDESFCPEGEAYQEGYLLTPYGLLGAVKLVEF
ncbi:MAG: glycosyl hydrolase [Lachnospiraceae bacterium]|nr:glycosyl hydrolase [Lachnospiraceae bacterium]